jgi:hypothetical protein
MATPNVKHKGVVVSAGSPCKRCSHILSDHVEEKGRQCTKCACVPQDTN